MPDRWSADDPASLAKFWGKRRLEQDNLPPASWEQANLTSLVVPNPMVLAWEPTRPVTRVRRHKRVASRLRSVLDGVLGHYVSVGKAEAARMHLYAGVHNYCRLAATG